MSTQRAPTSSSSSSKRKLNSKIINPVTSDSKKYVFQFNLSRPSWAHCCLYSLTETSPTVHFELDLSPIDVNIARRVGMCRNCMNCGWLLCLLCFVRCLVGIFCSLASFQFHWGIVQFLMESNCCVWLYFVKCPKAFAYKHPIKMHSCFIIINSNATRSRAVWTIPMAPANLSHPGWMIFVYLSTMPGSGSLFTVKFVSINSWTRSITNWQYIISVQVI